MNVYTRGMRKGESGKTRYSQPYLEFHTSFWTIVLINKVFHPDGKGIFCPVDWKDPSSA